MSCLIWFDYTEIILTNVFSAKVIVYRSPLIQVQATSELWHWDLLLFLSNAFSSCFAGEWLILRLFVHVYAVLSFAKFKLFDSEFLNAHLAGRGADALSFVFLRRDQLKGRWHLAPRYFPVAVDQWRLWNKTRVLNRSANWSYFSGDFIFVCSD